MSFDDAFTSDELAKGEVLGQLKRDIDLVEVTLNVLRNSDLDLEKLLPADTDLVRLKTGLEVLSEKIGQDQLELFWVTQPDLARLAEDGVRPNDVFLVETHHGHLIIVGGGETVSLAYFDSEDKQIYADQIKRDFLGLDSVISTFLAAKQIDVVRAGGSEGKTPAVGDTTKIGAVGRWIAESVPEAVYFGSYAFF